MDRRAATAKRHHDSAAVAVRQAARYRRQRDQLIRELSADGWTHAQLAALLGCVEGNIRYILSKGKKNK